MIRTFRASRLPRLAVAVSLLPALLMAGTSWSASPPWGSVSPATPPRASNYDPPSAVLTAGDMEVSGNPVIQGDVGSIHANGALTISGNPNVAKDATSTGALTVSGNPTVGGLLAGNQAAQAVPVIDPQNFAAHADYFMKANGKVWNPLNIEIHDGSGGIPFNGWKFTGSLWEHVDNFATPAATYFFETDVKVSDNPGTTQNPVQLTIIATGSVEISGNPKIIRDLPDVGIIAGRDLKISGLFEPSLPGFFAAHEQIELSGNVNLSGAVVAENAEDVSTLVTGGSGINISGNPTITYDGGLQTLIFIAPPDPPVIDSPADGAILTTGTPVVSGTSDGVGLTIDLFVDGNANGSTTSGVGGAWSLTVPTAIADGVHSLTAKATNSLGTSGGSAAVSVTIDTVAPVVSGPSPADGAKVVTELPVISASWTDATSGIDTATALVTLNGNDITGASVITATGFTHTPATALADGSYTVVVQVKDNGGLQGSLSWSFTVDRPPTLTLTPSDGFNSLDQTPTFTADYPDPDTDTNTFVAIIDGVNETANFTVGATQATFTPTTPLADGPHTFDVTISDTAGGTTQVVHTFRVVAAKGTITVAAGGTVQVTDSARPVFGAAIQVPAGAIAMDTEFTIEHVASPPALPQGYQAAGVAADFLPPSTFSSPATVTVPYDPTLLGGIPEEAVRLLRYDAVQSTWILVPVDTVDTVNNRVTANVNQLIGDIFVTAIGLLDTARSQVTAAPGIVPADGEHFVEILVLPRNEAGNILGPDLVVSVALVDAGTQAPLQTPTVQDLGNGYYRATATSTTPAEVRVIASVFDETSTLRDLDQQPEFIFSEPLPDFFTVDSFTNPLQAGVASDVTITAGLNDPGNPVHDTFIGVVQVDLTGTTYPAGSFPATFWSVFTPADEGILTLPSSLAFATAGLQTIKVTAVCDTTTVPAMGEAQITILPGDPDLIEEIAGDLQVGVPNAILPQRLVVRVTDAFDNPVPLVEVGFTVDLGGAMLIPEPEQ